MSLQVRQRKNMKEQVIAMSGILLRPGQVIPGL